jgi:hypothetical protein
MIQMSTTGELYLRRRNQIEAEKEEEGRLVERGMIANREEEEEEKR